MSRPVSIALVLALGATEGLAYWWMQPAPAGLGQPVLCYRPQMGDRGSRIVDRGSKIEDVAALPPLEDPLGSSSSSATPQNPATVTDRSHNPSDNSSSSIQNPTSNIQNSATVIDRHYTPLPEVVAQSLPKLHCSSGTAARFELDDGVSIIVAFFEWDLVDTGNVLEAYKHLPKVCMGSIGMHFIESRQARLFSIGTKILRFNHAVFHGPSGSTVHSFKATWVSGASELLGNRTEGSHNQQRLLRWESALKRFRPAYARVVQGTVHGVQNPDRAWQAFQDAMLVDLTFEAYPKEGQTPIRPAHVPMTQAQ